MQQGFLHSNTATLTLSDVRCFFSFLVPNFEPILAWKVAHPKVFFKGHCHKIFDLGYFFINQLYEGSLITLLPGPNTGCLQILEKNSAK
jgi:hypothetical protein